MGKNNRFSTAIDAGVFPKPVRNPRTTVSLLDQAQQLTEAISLFELGAPTSLVIYLTGLKSKAVNQLYKEIKGKQSRPGQTPFTDAWYIKDTRRMLQSAIVWGLHRRYPERDIRPARRLMEVYEAYRLIVKKPLLNLIHTFYVPRLVAMATWQERTCQACSSLYLAPPADQEALCPGCVLYFQYRCRHCGRAMPVHGVGRHRKACAHCQAS